MSQSFHATCSSVTMWMALRAGKGVCLGRAYVPDSVKRLYHAVLHAAAKVHICTMRTAGCLQNRWHCRLSGKPMLTH
jgi:hypothetical protein